mgnify:CR=1 FL=1
MKITISEEGWEAIGKEGPGVRNYKGKVTLFYNGEILWEGNDEVGHPLIYDWEERDSWEVIIILPGVEVIPEFTFYDCDNVKTVIMNDSVRRIESLVFEDCYNLKFVKLSTNLEYIGHGAFNGCSSLASVNTPSSCREIGDYAFGSCTKLIILS